MGFSPVADHHAGDEQNAHHREDGPALALVADHAAKHIGEAGAEREDRNHMDIVSECCRALIGMRGIRIEEAAAVGAQMLDHHLRGDGALRDGLLGAFERRRVDISAEILRHALPDEHDRTDDADRHQHIERAARDIDPEVAHRLCRRTGKAADQRDRNHDAGRPRQKVLVREAEHLHEIRQRALTTVVLPVGVSDEADGGIESKVGRHRRLFGWIERQNRLEAHQGIEEPVKDEEAANMEEQHGDRICQPMLFAFLVDAAGPIERRFHRPQHR